MQETLIGSSAYCLRAWNPAGIRGLDGVTVHDMTPVRRKAELPRFILPPGLWHNGFHMLNLQRALALKGAASTSLTYAPQASTTAHYAQNLADVAKLHPDEDRIVAGHSNGGLIMFPASEQLLAGDLRKKTKGFAFINSVIPSQFRQGLTVGLAKSAAQHFLNMTLDRPVKLSDSTIDNTLFSGRQHKEFAFDAAPGRVTWTVARSTIPWFGYRPKMHLPTDLPMLVVGSLDDRAVGYENSIRLHRKLVAMGISAQMETMSGSHEVVLTHADELAGILISFAERQS